MAVTSYHDSWWGWGGHVLLSLCLRPLSSSPALISLRARQSGGGSWPHPRALDASRYLGQTNQPASQQHPDAAGKLNLLIIICAVTEGTCGVYPLKQTALF